MARAPRAKVPKSSGAGVSRLSYQKGYALGNKGSSTPGDAPSISSSPKGEALKSAPGGKGKIDAPSGMNISYGDTLPIGSLEDVKAVSKRPLPKGGPKTGQAKAKSYAK